MTPGAGRWRYCFADHVELNREMVRQGWALAYYPERGAVPGPVYMTPSSSKPSRAAGAVVGVVPATVGLAPAMAIALALQWRDTHGGDPADG